MGDPQIIGLHNADLDASRARLDRAGSYRDLSTICVVPTRGVIPARVAESWMGLQNPMNQKFIRLFVSGMEVGAAYTAAIETILANEELSKWKYLLSLEEDNIPPPDGLLKLYEPLESDPELAAVSGLYWTKGPGGQPMIYGNPAEPINFIPQVPVPDSLQYCHGIGMGFALWRLDVFKDPEYTTPFFETVQRIEPGKGFQAYSQDLHGCERMRKLGYKFAVDTRIKVGHYDYAGMAGEPDMVW